MTPLILNPGTLCALIGPPGCGKSTFAARYPDSWRVSLDVYRKLATDFEAEESATPVAAEIQTLLLDSRFSRGLITLVDSTNVFPHVRAGLIARARYWQRPAVAVLFDVPLATVEERNAGRERVVPVNVVREFHELLPTVDQLYAEGFAAVHLASELATTAHPRPPV
ncbi:AAA family ATPase [Streptomyces sp. NPDC088116]|uniref:AAA family ATPase n=1 Tax=Streptomyces sp. NPDC088116 TaxID=3365825 RepID=UPI00382BB2DB